MGAESTRPEAEARRAEIAVDAPEYAPDPATIEYLRILLNNGFDDKRGAPFAEEADEDAEAEHSLETERDEPVSPAPLTAAERDQIRMEEDDARMHTTREMRRVEGISMDLGLGSGENNVGAGMMARNNSGDRAMSAKARREARRRAGGDVARVMAMLDAQIARLEALSDRIGEQIDQNQAEIDQLAEENEQLETEIGELTELHSLIENGEFDPDNPEHAALLDRYGIDGDLEREEMLAAVDDEIAEREGRVAANDAQIDGLNRRNDELRALRDDIERDIDDVQARRDQLERDIAEGRVSPEEGEAIAAQLDEEEFGEKITAYEAKFEQVDIQTASAVEDTDEADASDARTVDVQTSIDDELESFMRGLAEAQQTGDPLERLARERELVEGLSEDAAFQASMQDDTAALFEDGYFDALDEERAAEAAPAPAAGPSFGQ